MPTPVELLARGFTNALSPENLFYAFAGSLIGTLVGVLPGIGPTAGLAILMPLTAVLPPSSAIIMMAAVYYGAMYGGSTTAIVVNIPEFRLTARNAKGETLEMRVVVGRASRNETPVFEGELRHVVFRPTWSVPPSIDLISCAAAVVIGSAALTPGFSIDSRTMPMRIPPSAPGDPEARA